MPTDKPDYFIITGGPGAGKTTIIEALAARGHFTVTETGRAITREQVAISGDAHHAGDRQKYLALMLARGVADYERASALLGPVFFDRGIAELTGYCRLSGFPVPDALRDAVSRYRTSAHVFIAPPWPEIYVRDAERKQDFAEAIASFDLCVAAYDEAGYALVEIPKAPVAERADFVLVHVAAWTTLAP